MKRLANIVLLLLVVGVVIALAEWAFSPKGENKPAYEGEVLRTESLNRSQTIQKQDTMSEKKLYALIETEKGTMKAELYKDETPGTVQNFVDLANHNFYDGLTFHRVIPDFVIQGGCPRGDGTGGPGYRIKCETSAPRQYHDRGVMSMAHAGKDTGGSQFFICHCRENTQHLDGVHTCFGKVIEGLEVIDDIRPGDRMLSVRIVEE